MEEMEKFSDLTEKKSHKGIVCGLLIVLLLGLIGFGYYYKSKPEVVFKLAANRAYKGFSVKQLKSKSKVDLDLAFNVKADENSEVVEEDAKKVFDIVNDMLLKLSIYEDDDNNIYKVDIEADYKNKELVAVDAYYENKKVYLDLNDLYDKLIYDEVDLEEFTKKVDKDDIKVVIDEYYKALNKALDKGTFTTEKVELNGSKVTKNKLIINNDNKDEMFNALMGYLRNSDKLIKALSKITEMEVSEVKEMLNSEMSVPELQQSIELSVYTKGLMSKVVKASVGMDGMEILTLSKVSDKNYELAIPKSLGVDFKCNINEKNTNNAAIKCSLSAEGLTMSYEMNVKVDDNYKLEKPNLEKAISYEDVKEEDTADIMKKLTEKDGVKELLEAFSAIEKNFFPQIEDESFEIEPIEKADIEEIG